MKNIFSIFQFDISASISGWCGSSGLYMLRCAPNRQLCVVYYQISRHFYCVPTSCKLWICICVFLFVNLYLWSQGKLQSVPTLRKDRTHFLWYGSNILQTKEKKTFLFLHRCCSFGINVKSRGLKMGSRCVINWPKYCIKWSRYFSQRPFTRDVECFLLTFHV